MSAEQQVQLTDLDPTQLQEVKKQLDQVSPSRPHTLVPMPGRAAECSRSWTYSEMRTVADPGVGVGTPHFVILPLEVRADKVQVVHE
jgi:hypothetical protein